MRLILTIIICFCFSILMAQTKQLPTTINGGNNQFGNNNTQYIFEEPRLTKDNAADLEKLISKIEADSNFYSIKYFRVSSFLVSNGATIKAEIAKYFTIYKGWKDAGSNLSMISNRDIVYGVSLEISKKDSCLIMGIGVL